MKNSFILLVIFVWFLLVNTQLLNDVLSAALCMVKCIDEGCKHRCIKSSNNTARIPLLEKETKSNISLQCKDVNRLVLKHNPGIYVIEGKSEEDNIWKFPIISNDIVCEFSNLNPGSRYQYRIREVTIQGVALPETTKWFKTNEAKYTPQNVKNISIGQIETSRKNPSRLQTYLNIVPADDLNCLYNVIHWGEEHNLYQYQLDASRDYRLKLGHLKYDKNNTVYVVSRNEVGLQQSKNVNFSFFTPSCLSLHHDLTVCAPPPVTGLEVNSSRSNKNLVDFKITWDKPELYPNNYTVIIEPIDRENNSTELTIFGNESVANIPAVILNHKYKIGVIAESEGGTSFQWLMFTIPEQSTVQISQVLFAISTLITIVIILTIVYTYYRYKDLKGYACRYSFFENISRKSCDVFDEVKNPLKPPLTYDKEDDKLKDKFEIQIDRLTIKKLLGSGISGIVKLAILQENQEKSVNVAVKMLREDASAEDVKNFHREISLMKCAGNHRNIVSLIGCCTLSKNPLLVVEYCSKGDLQTYLRTILEEAMATIFNKTRWPITSNVFHFQRQNFTRAINNRLYDIQRDIIPENKLTPEDLLNFAWQIATGMEYLSSNRIVHRDLAARNVLVCADRTIKISDFGLSRDIYQENVYKKHSNGKLPLKWMAIEALTHQIYTTQSDVWSFGILLYEIVTLGGNPYPGLQSSQILPLLKSGYRMEQPSNCGFHLYKIMSSCWQENPLSRPTFSQLKHELDNLLSSITKNEYLNLTELLKDPIQQRYLEKFESQVQNILTIPNIS